MRKGRSGVGLGLTLSIVAVVTILAFALTSASVTNSQLLARIQQQHEAENVAQSVTRLTVERILENSDFGRKPVVPLVIKAGFAQGTVVFQSGDSVRLGIPVSVNNLNGSSPVQASGGSLSPGNARIVAEGRCGGARKLLECSLNLPSFPYAIAAGGRIQCSGGLTVAAVDSLADLDRLAKDPDYVPGPAGLSSNCPTEAVVLQGTSLIAGDVDSVGRVSLSANTQVLGAIRSPKDSLRLPEVEIASYDPAGRPTCRNVRSITPSTPIRDQLRVQGDLIVDGDVDLSNGQIYVDGNLTIRGAVRGTGAIVTTGNLQVERGSQLDANNRAALLCGGNLSLAGQARESSYFNGLVYCKGQLRARQLTIIGALLTGGQDVNSEQVSLADCSIVQRSAPIMFNSSPKVFKFISHGYAVLVRQQGARLEMASGSRNATGVFSDTNSLRFDPDDLSSVATYGQVRGEKVGPDDSSDEVAIERADDSGVKVAKIATFPLLAASEQKLAFMQQLRDVIREDEVAQGGAVFLFDPSRFLQWRDRVKISRWRSL